MDGVLFIYAQAYLMKDHTLAFADRVLGNENENCNNVIRTKWVCNNV